jgi:hypothetical protein
LWQGWSQPGWSTCRLLSSNIRLAGKKTSRNKRDSLLCPAVSDKEKKFYNFYVLTFANDKIVFYQPGVNTNKTFFSVTDAKARVFVRGETCQPHPIFSGRQLALPALE